MEVTRRRGRRRKKLLDDLKDRRGYSHLKEEALDRTMWRNRFGGGFRPVVRQNNEWMNTNVYSLCDNYSIINTEWKIYWYILHTLKIIYHILTQFRAKYKKENLATIYFRIFSHFRFFFFLQKKSEYGNVKPTPVVARPKAWVCIRLIFGIESSNPAESTESVSCECSVLWGRGLCDESIIRPGEYYRVKCVWV